MSATKKKYPSKCKKCGDEVTSSGYAGYCYDYGKETWNAGFDSTSEHANEIFD